MKINFGMTGTAAYLQHQLDNRHKSVGHEVTGPTVSFGKKTYKEPEMDKFSLISNDGDFYPQCHPIQLDRRFNKRLDLNA
jgi:hypothetical protein